MDIGTGTTGIQGTRASSSRSVPAVFPAGMGGHGMCVARVLSLALALGAMLCFADRAEAQADTTRPAGSFMEVPASHDGITPFTMTLVFTEEVRRIGLNLRAQLSNIPTGGPVTYTPSAHGPMISNGGKDPTDRRRYTFTVTPRAPVNIAVQLRGGHEDLSGNPGAIIRANPIPYVGQNNGAPTANAGPDQRVAPGATVRLNGIASRDMDGIVTTYAWTRTGGTTGGMVTLSDASAARPTFTADTLSPGAADVTHIFSLVVTDDDGADSAADTVTVTVTTGNLPPTANAGPNQTVATGATVQLDGRGSLDSDGTVDTYAWVRTGGTTGGMVTLSDAGAAQPTFTADTLSSGAADVTHVFSLVVTDDDNADSAADTVTVTVTAPPTVSISRTRFPSSITQGGFGTITLERSSATALRPVLQAYVRVTSTNFTSNNIFGASFARNSATATVTVNIPASIVSADETATVTVLTPTDAAGGGRTPGAYSVSTGTALARTFTLANIPTVIITGSTSHVLEGGSYSVVLRRSSAATSSLQAYVRVTSTTSFAGTNIVSALFGQNDASVRVRVNTPAVSADETVTVTVLTPTDAAGGGRSPGAYNVGSGTARTRTFTLYNTPTVSISDTSFPDSIIQGNSGTITLERSGATAIPPRGLHAYVRVTSTSFTSNNIFRASFARHSATATVTVNIPANIVSTDETATVTVLTRTQAASQSPAPGAYDVGSGTALTRTFTLANASPTVSISNTGFPSSIIQGGSGTITLGRSSTTTAALQAYVRVTSTSFTRNNIFSASFATGSDSATVTVNIPANTVSTDETATVTVLTPSQATAADNTLTPGAYEVGSGTALTRTFTLANAPPTVSISSTRFPSSITQGGFGIITLGRSGTSTGTLQAYVRVASTNFTSGNIFGASFSQNSATATVTVNIPANIVSADETATVTVLTPEQVTAADNTLTPGAYGVEQRHGAGAHLHPCQRSDGNHHQSHRPRPRGQFLQHSPEA